MDFHFSEKYKPLFEVLAARGVIEDKHFVDNEDDVKKHWNELSNVDTVLISGGRDCFYSDQLVVTGNGSTKIKDIKTGDLILTYNESTKENELNKVARTRSVKKDKTVKIKLKSGTLIECTLDHEFYYKGCWTKVKDLLSLWYGDLEENTEV